MHFFRSFPDFVFFVFSFFPQSRKCVNIFAFKTIEYKSNCKYDMGYLGGQYPIIAPADDALARGVCRP